MAYADIHQVANGPRTAGDILGRVEVAFTVYASERSVAITATDDQRERSVVQRCLFGDIPRQWVIMALHALDTNRKPLLAASDADITAAVTDVWWRVVKAMD